MLFHFHLVTFSLTVPTLFLLPSAVEELEQQRVYAMGQQPFGQLHEPLCDDVSERVRLASAASFTGTYTHSFLSPLFTRMMTRSSADSCFFAPPQCFRFWRPQPVTWRHRCVSLHQPIVHFLNHRPPSCHLHRGDSRCRRGSICVHALQTPNLFKRQKGHGHFTH